MGEGTTDRKEDIEEAGDKLFTYPSDPIPLTQGQYEKFVAFSENKKKDAGTYFALANNCVDFVEEGLDFAGVKVDDLPLKFSPEALREGGAAARYLVRNMGVAPAHPANKSVFPTKDGPSLKHFTERKYFSDQGRKEFTPENSIKVKPNSAANKQPTGASETDIPAPRAKASADSKKWVEDFIKDDGPKDMATEAMLKKPDAWTEDEVRAVTGKRMGLAPTDPAYDKMEKAERAFYSAHYGDDPVGYDSTGKMEAPVAKKEVADKPSPVTSPDGKPVGDGMKAIAAQVVSAAQKGDLTQAVKGLQTGVNIMKKPDVTPLKTDGIAGPKTKDAVKATVTTMGAPKVNGARAIGTIAEAAKNPKVASNPQALKKVVDDNVGPLLGETKAAESTLSGEAFQGAVNDTGKVAIGASFTPIKEDGYVGPKTTDAFGQVAAVDQPGLFKNFGKGVGLFG